MPNKPTPLTADELRKADESYCHFQHIDVVYVPNDVIPRILATVTDRDKRIAELERPPHCIEIDGMHQCSHCGTTLRADSPDCQRVETLERLVAVYRAVRVANMYPIPNAGEFELMQQLDPLNHVSAFDRIAGGIERDALLALARAERPDAGGEETT